MVKKKRKSESRPKSHIDKQQLLQLLKAGMILSVALVAPNALRVFKSFAKEKDPWDEYYPSSIERETFRLWRKGYVEVIEMHGGYKVQISDKGKTEILKYDLNSMSIALQETWDGKWRMVFFDIPASKKVRNVFRNQLRTLGFFPMQESVYVYPYPCTREIKFLREVYGISHQVKLAKVESIENDRDLRHYFHLRL